jgi:hypothetical protein
MANGGSACLDTSAQARKEILMRVAATMHRLLTANVAFASRELMALDPGDWKVCGSRSSSVDQNFAVI